MVQVQGKQILSESKQRAQSFIPLLDGKKVTIVRFEPPNDIDEVIWAKHEAARYSTEAKQRTFESMGCHVDVRLLSSQTTLRAFEAVLVESNLDSNVLGVIVQNPIPLDLQGSLALLSPEKDLDGMNPGHPFFRVSATSETIFRLLYAFADRESPVAVVGARGFVGAGVVQLLRQAQIPCIPLDMGDDLLKTNDASIIVSATGVAEILDERHINSEHRLVVDAGFVPTSHRGILGDVNRSAYDLPQSISPVPGGIGSMQMATLLERAIQVLGGRIEPWTFVTPEQRVYALQILPTAIELFREQERCNALQRLSPSTLQVQGQYYNLIVDLEKQDFTVQAQDGRGILMKAQKNEDSQVQVTLAVRLTPDDVDRWQNVQQVLSRLRLQGQQSERSSEGDLGL
jgi:methylenetetrahydrofolate dehydrogenase (NADP+) / methenyltetrahydrofolate cyclohydrolase